MRWIAVLGIFVVATAALVLAVRALRRRRRPPATRPRYPVVLVHGILLGWRRDSLAGIAEHLEALGTRVHHARLPPMGSVPERAACLVAFLRALPPGRVNLIAHSMGGLDARWAITKLGAADRIASLVTVGTPHHGTPLADLGQSEAALTARALADKLGLTSDSLDWLTPARMTWFNNEIPDHPRVVYASVVCRAGATLWRQNPLLLPTHAWVKQRAGTNDGLVPASSQRWGETLCEVEVDHWGQIGRISRSDARPVYARILSELAARGL